MAEILADVTKVRNLAITKLIVGFLLFCFGIAEQIVVTFWTKGAFIPIWGGVVVSRRSTVKCYYILLYSRNWKCIEII